MVFVFFNLFLFWCWKLDRIVSDALDGMVSQALWAIVHKGKGLPLWNVCSCFYHVVNIQPTKIQAVIILVDFCNLDFGQTSCWTSSWPSPWTTWLMPRVWQRLNRRKRKKKSAQDPYAVPRVRHQRKMARWVAVLCMWRLMDALGIESLVLGSKTRCFPHKPSVWPMCGTVLAVEWTIRFIIITVEVSVVTNVLYVAHWHVD